MTQPPPPPPRSVMRRLLALATPIIGLNVLNVLALAVDTAMCGRLPEAEQALTALGFATQVIFLLMVAMIGLTVGTVALVARAFGAGMLDRVNHILHQSTLLTVLVSLVVALVGNLFAPQIISGLGASDEVVAVSLDYLRPLLTGTVFNYLLLLYAAVMRGVGNTRLPFMIAVVTNILNFLFNYGLILGNWGMPALGVQGAALGTVLSQMIGVAAYFFLLSRGQVKGLRLPLKLAPIDRELAGTLLRIGAPAALDMVILNAAFLSIVGMLGRLDEVSVAAHGIGLRIQGLAFVPGMSISQATGAMVGQALGAGDAAQARKVVRASVVLCTGVMTALAVAIVLLAQPIVGIFDVAPGTPLEAFSVLWIELLGYGMPIMGVYIPFVGMLQGAGQTRTSLQINAATTLLAQIPLSAILGFALGWGVFGVWLAFPASFVLKAACGVAVYKRDRWAVTGAKA